MKKDLFGICPYTTAQKILSGKWTLLILYYLSTRTMRFGELQRALPEMTQATLSRQLQEMEQNGLIVRTAYNQIPPKVEYSLDKPGRDFLPVLVGAQGVGQNNISPTSNEQLTKASNRPAGYPPKVRGFAGNAARNRLRLRRPTWP